MLNMLSPTVDSEVASIIKPRTSVVKATFTRRNASMNGSLVALIRPYGQTDTTMNSALMQNIRTCTGMEPTVCGTDPLGLPVLLVATLTTLTLLQVNTITRNDTITLS